MASSDLCLHLEMVEAVETVVVADRATSELLVPAVPVDCREDREALEDLRSDRRLGSRWEVRARSVTECVASGRCPSSPPLLTGDTTGCGG